MEIQIDYHSLQRAEERGTTADEIRDVINNGTQISAKRGRLGKAKVYDFNQERHGKLYHQKRVEVIYTLVGELAITITVYVFYGKWESENANPI